MFQDIMERVFLGNPVLDYAIFVGIFLGGFIAITIIRVLVIRRLKRWAEKTTTTIDDFIIRIIQKIVVPLTYLGVFYASVNILQMDLLVKKIIDIFAIAVLTIFVARLIITVVTEGFAMYLAKMGKSEALERSLKGISGVLKIIVWGMAITFFLDNLGFKISAVIAGLGIGGVAVALAAQAVLGDLFSYFAIIFDRPFEIGDFIIIGDYLGAIEYIGIKTTRIRSLGGEQLIFSNTDLTNSRVRNYKRMQKRRVLFKLGVTYQTPLAKLKKISDIIKNIINNVEDTAFDRAHFSEYGDFNLVIEIVYYVMGPDYNKYMDTQQQINFAIKEAFEKEGIEFAYPTQTLYVNKS